VSRPAPASRPVFDLIGGPQGSGKSTFFPVSSRGCAFFNIDDRRRELNGGSAQGIPEAVRRKAAAEYLAFIRRQLREKRSFAIEVTLAKEITFTQARRAARAGFRVRLTYVAAPLEDSILRVANRVDAGGHGVGAAVIRRTYAASMKNLPRALAAFDVVQVYDNSAIFGPDAVGEDSRPIPVLETQLGKISFSALRLPDWLRSALSGSPFEFHPDH